MTEPIEAKEILDRILVGRVSPHIYAFTTNTIPNYLKVGDTYRPVSVRLDEWKRYFPDLSKQFEGAASIDDDVYFRDYAVHQFLEVDKQRRRLLPRELQEGVYYSKEFFQEAMAEDVVEAIGDIHKDYETKGGRYEYYDASTHLPQGQHYERGAVWTLRPNQEAAVNSFLQAYQAGRKNLLMYAVMRFGKSFTSLCCAKAMGARTVLIVSAKADVKAEWKKTVESAGNFAGFEFLGSDELARDEDALTKLDAAGKVSVIFLTLQDLQGEEMKAKHRQIFDRNIDLLIVDETHFGARAEAYGKVLKNAGQPVDPEALLRREADDAVDAEEADTQLKQLHVDVRLHLSGTPYRLLMGSEFAPEDIIAFVQFTDIVHDQEAWDRAHLDDDQEGVNEWDNPYFGFPQMVRFAFNPNASSRKKLQELQQAGITYALSALLEPCSIKEDKKDHLHHKFKNEAEILDLLKVIDGSEEDSELLSFLDYDKIKEGRMCRHLVMVLPYCASCDAMETLITAHRDGFKNLGGYKIINVSGLEGAKNYRSPEDVKRVIAQAEDADQKTLTLTVNRMLTGSTVEQWDTMLYLKDTASPQEYDQAIFRLQNQYTRELVSDAGNIIKENLKPQTLLVDFDPLRLFRMQEQKALIYNANSEQAGNDKLEERIAEELRISPVISMNSNKIHQVEAADILEAISAYNRNRSIADEARDIPIDFGLLRNADIRAVIEAQAELGSKQGLTIQPIVGDADELDVSLGELEDWQPDQLQPKEGAIAEPQGTADEVKSLAKKLQTYYQRILFYAMLSPEDERSLADIVAGLDRGRNPRLAKNLGLEPVILRQMLESFDPFKLSQLDYKIQNISRLGEDERLSPVERASRALEKFSRLSGSEVRTPAWLCKEMVDQIPGQRLIEAVKKGEKLLDLGSKSGEYAIALYDRLTQELGLEEELVTGAIYSIPTSGIAYEFTRRFYEILGLNTDCIAEHFTVYDLLPRGKGQTISGDVVRVLSQDKPLKDITLADVPAKGGRQVKFAAIVGNPPYQEDDGGAQASAKPIYPYFVQLAQTLKPEFASFIVPTRWYAGGKGLDAFREFMLTNNHISQLHDFLNPEAVFPGTNNRGGVCYFLMDRDYDAKTAGGTRVITRVGQTAENTAMRSLNSLNAGIFVRDSIGVGIIEKVTHSAGFEPLSEHISSRKPFGLDGDIVRSTYFSLTREAVKDPVTCYGKSGLVGYIPRSLIRTNEDWIRNWKVLTPYANNIGTELNDDNQNAFVVRPNSVCSETFLVMGFDVVTSERKGENLSNYLKTKFARFLLSQAKISQHGTKQTYRFVPLPDLSESSPIHWNTSLDQLDEQLFSLYGLTDEEKQHIRLSIKDMTEPERRSA